MTRAAYTEPKMFKTVTEENLPEIKKKKKYPDLFKCIESQEQLLLNNPHAQLAQQSYWTSCLKEEFYISQEVKLPTKGKKKIRLTSS